MAWTIKGTFQGTVILADDTHIVHVWGPNTDAVAATILAALNRRDQDRETARKLAENAGVKWLPGWQEEIERVDRTRRAEQDLAEKAVRP